MFQTILKSLLIFSILLGTHCFAQQTGHVPGELLIQTDPRFNATLLFRNAEEALKINFESTECISPVMSIYYLKLADPSVDLNKLISYFHTTEGFLKAQKNHLVHERETIPSDTLFDLQWFHKNVGQTGGVVDADIDSPEAWDITTGGLTTHGDTIVVCIIEGSGVDINHIDLKDNIWKNYAEIPDDGIDNDNNGYVDDFNGWHVITLDDVIGAGLHGTRVAGMIGATGNNVTGVSGVNWNVKMMVVQGQQASNEATVIAAYNYPLTMRKRYNQTQGEEGAFVVATNSSWGINGGDPADSPLWCAMYDSLGYYGILNVAATTNNNANVDVVGDLPTACPSEYLVAVTMTNSQDLRANSGYGTTHVDLGAPGSSVRTTSPTNTYVNMTGTSFATPCVAGCVALAYSAPCAEFINYVKEFPADAALDMKNYLLESVDQTPGLLTEVSSGGRANVKNYIDSLLAGCDPSACITPYYLNVSNLSDSAATLNWQGFNSDFIVWFSASGVPAVPINITGNSLLLDTLQPCSYYAFSVQTNCGADSSNMSYTITFRTDGCCENPPLQLTDKTTSSITLAWNPVLSSTSYDLRYKLVSEATWIELSDLNSPYEFTGLLQCADYEFQILTHCADSTQGYSSSYEFTTMGCGACTELTYCDATGGNTALEWLEGISLNGFTNSTGNNAGWLVSNQIITALTPGSTYNISLIPGYTSSVFTEAFSIWIDFNYNGIFETTENLINNVSSNGILNTVISIPLSATPGVTKMRIAMRGNFVAPEICPMTSFYGEYEDYCVYIGPQVGLEEGLQSEMVVFPNPSENGVTLSGDESVQSIRITDYAGKEVSFEYDSNTRYINLEQLGHGIYLIYIETAQRVYLEKLIKL